MKKFYDEKYREKEFMVRYGVFKTTTMQTTICGCKKILKLLAKYFGPFKVLQRIGKVVYKLEMSSNSRIHPLFHVSLLKKKIGEELVQQQLPNLDSVEERLIPLPQAVLDRRIRKKKHEVMIHWQGLSPADAT